MSDDPRREAYKAARRAGLSPEEALAAADKAGADFSDVAGAGSTTATSPPQHPYARLWNTVARPAIQGATFGFSDELRGAGAALIPGGDDYITARNKERDALAAARDDHPIIAGASELAGGLVVPAGVFGKATQGAGYGRRILEGAKIGARVGGLVGLGKAEGENPEGYADPGDLATGAAVGGATGGVVGAAIPAVLGAPGAIRRLGERIGERVADRLPPDRMVPDAADVLDAVVRPEGPAVEPGPPQTLREALERSRAARGLPPEGQAVYRRTGPTPRTRVFPMPRTPDPVAAPAVNEPPMGQPTFNPADIARRIRAATSGGPPLASSPADLVSRAPTVEQQVAERLMPRMDPRAEAELAARVQKGATRGQLQYRENLFGLPKVTPNPPEGAPLPPAEEMDLLEAIRRSLELMKSGGQAGSLRRP